MTPGDTVNIIREQLSASVGWTIETVEPLHSSSRSYSRHLTCRVRLTDGTEHVVFVKFVSGVSKDKARLEELVAGDNAVSCHLYEAFRSSHGFSVPRPLAYSRDHLMLISEHVDGTRLQDKIIRTARLFARSDAIAELEADCFRSGRWLQKFQQETRTFALARKTPGRDDLLDAPAIVRLIVERVDRLRSSRVLNHAEAHRLVAFAETAARLVKPDESMISGIHADFFPGNVIVDGETVIGIDFVMFRRGSIHFDPTYFIFQLETLAAQVMFRRAVIERLEQAFLNGYNPELRMAWFWKANPLVELLFLMHATGRLISLAASAPRGLARRMLADHSMRALRRRLAEHVQDTKPRARR